MFALTVLDLGLVVWWVVLRFWFCCESVVGFGFDCCVWCFVCCDAVLFVLAL